MNTSTPVHTKSLPRRRTLTLTNDSLCMVHANGWEIMYAQVKPGVREIESALRHARNVGAEIIDNRTNEQGGAS